MLVTKFGKQNEVINAHIQSLMNLPMKKYCQLEKRHEFYEKLTNYIQAMQPLRNLEEINSNSRNISNKLTVIRTDIVRTEDDWQEYDFVRFVEVLFKQT